MELKVKQIENGYLLEWKEEIEEDEFKTCQEAIVSEDDEKKEMEELLYWIADYFGYNYDKFSKENLKISWNKRGHKV